jgi:hypothetical protein
VYLLLNQARYIAMFGALNRFIARLDGEPPPRQTDTGPSDTSYGFQVLRNTNKELQLEPWFDFIIGMNGHHLVSMPTPACRGQLEKPAD